jgi:hypothetical protein
MAGVLMLTMVWTPVWGQADPPAPAAIALQAATFVPGAGQPPALPPGLAISGYAPGQRGYYVVQFAGPVQQAWKDQVTAQGGELLDYIPNFAFKVRMNPAQAARIAALEAVAWVGLFQPAYKLSPELDLEGLNLVRVRIERGADYGQVRSAVARSGAEVLGGAGEILLVAATGEQLQAIARVLDVAWVETYTLPEKHNEYGAGTIVAANTAHANGYDGSTQIAAVSDTGLGEGTAAGAHADIPASRIVNIYNWPGSAGGCFQSISDDGAMDVDSGHGTHTAVSVLGDGGAAGEGKGAAPGAGLVFQATENWATISNFCQIVGGWPANGYFLTGLPDDLRTMYQQAYNAGARIHSNSWGAALAGDYTLDSANTDDFIWDNPDMTITFSAGNAGVDANNNGVVDADSIGSPATAKNVITVGASEGDRQGNYQCDTSLTYTSQDAYQVGQTCNSMGGNQSAFLGTWGSRYGFPTNPLKDDVTAGNAGQMAAWSSRGPTDDGRIKPDVVAPGSWILSGYSSLYQEGYGDPVNPRNSVYQWDGWGMPVNANYKYMGGTSMSNPIAAGAATVVRDFYQKAYGHSASAALVKATLINSAVDLPDENNDGVDDNDYPIPNIHEGWGRVNLAGATAGDQQFYDESTGLATGGSAVYPFDLSGGSAFKVSLVWSDYPSTEAAALNLVNDLDLLLTAPGGAQYRGNVFAGGWSQSGGSSDRTNNVENVYIQSAAAGIWTVEVSGYNVPNSPQPYALIVDGGSGAEDRPPTVSITAPAGGTTVSGRVDITADASDDNGVTQVEFFVDGATIGVDETAPYSVQWDSAAVSDGGHTISATATDTTGQPASDSVTVTIDNEPDPTLHVGDLEGSSAEAPRGRWSALVTITVHDNAEAVVDGATVTGLWSGGATGSDSCVTSGGSCTITKTNLKSNVTSVTFSVSSIAYSGATYVPAANHDADGDSDGTTIIIPSPAANSAPAVSIDAPADGATFASGATIAFSGGASDAEDGDVSADLVWISDLDGQIGTGGSFSAVLGDGSHTITATATDSAGASGSATVGITVGEPPPGVIMHVGDLDGSSAVASRNRWDATVTITVHDASEGPVAGANVTGSWSAAGSATCTTGAAGQCSLTLSGIKQNVVSVTFEVTDITRNTGDTYDAGANHDPDGDSNGTRLTISQS